MTLAASWLLTTVVGADCDVSGATTIATSWLTAAADVLVVGVVPFPVAWGKGAGCG